MELHFNASSPYHTYSRYHVILSIIDIMFDQVLVMCRGKQIQTVPMMPMIEQINIKNQFSILSLALIRLPNIFRWNATGRMIQMLKHMADPMRPMMISKLGITIASTVIMITKMLLIEPFSKWRVQLGGAS